MKISLLELCQQTLKEIVANDFLFRVAIKGQTKKYDITQKEDISNLSTVLGANLRHYYLIEKILKDEGLSLLEDEKLYASVIISDSLFSKKISIDDIKKLSSNNVDYLKLYEKYSSLDSIAQIKEERLNHKISEFEYLSIRYNTPLWLIKMWHKHFPKALKLILKNNIHESDTSFAIKKDEITLQEVLAIPEFKPSIYDDMVLYRGKGVRNLEIFNKNLIYPLREAERAIFDEIKINPDDRIVIFVDQKGEKIHFKVKELIDDTNWVKYLTSSHEDYSKTRAIIKDEFLRKKKSRNNFVSYRVDRKDVHTCLLDDKDNNDLFILFTKSSNFDEIRRSPDYLIHFKMESLDEIIQNEKSSILEAMNYLKVGGKLVYIITTLNNKEGRKLINSVVKENPSINLVKEHQYYPFSDVHNSLYYAILEKKELENND